MKLRHFAEECDDINSITGNNDIIAKVESLLDTADGNALAIVARFVQGQVFPQYEQRNLSFSTSLMRDAIAEVTGIESDDIKSRVADLEDMGALFEEIDESQVSDPQSRLVMSNVTVDEVYQSFEQIAEESGSGSQKRKVKTMTDLLSRCDTNIERKYLTRITLGNMSIGVGQGTVRKAIARQYDVPESLVERKIMLTNDIGYVAQTVDKHGRSGLEDITVDVGERPLRSMKASKLDSYKNSFDEIGADRVLTDYKYDGFRIQAHKMGDNVRLFTRRLQDVTDSLPDVVESVQKNVDAEKIILDGEIVGYETKNYEKPIPYQDTQKRIRRKYNIDEMKDEIPVVPKFFDVLYYDQQLVIDDPLSDRVEYLNTACDDSIIARQEYCTTPDEIHQMMQDAQSDGHEGCILKHPDSTYQPNKRGKSWMKLKPEGETVDAVIIGGEFGDGRRSSYIASFNLGLWEDDELVSIGEMGTGLTDEQFETMTDLLEDDIVSQDGKTIELTPNVVVEVKFEEVQESEDYESGYSLRFPTFVQRRPNKSIDQADTISRLENISETL